MRCRALTSENVRAWYRKVRADVVVGGGWLSGDGVWFGFAGSGVGVRWFVVSIEAVVVV